MTNADQKCAFAFFEGKRNIVHNISVDGYWIVPMVGIIISKAGTGKD